jgi:hypothetical protein
MKIVHWLIVVLIILAIFGGGFLYQFRVESDERVGKTGEPTAAEFSHDRFDRVLQTYVDSRGRVNYAALKQNPQDLEAYLDQLATASLENLTPDAQLAFWINAYNALTIKGVLDHYPTRSVHKIKPLRGFFYRLKFQVGGKNYTLNEIEHDIIREEFAEPRIHFVLVCASGGCPSLENRAFFPETLKERLDDATFKFIINPEKVRLDRANGVLYLSKIFDWYKADFEDTHPTMLEFILDYLPHADADFIKREGVTVRYLDYDWTLNDQGLQK